MKPVRYTKNKLKRKIGQKRHKRERLQKTEWEKKKKEYIKGNYDN